jgi:peptidoglycan/xylan/chitin deacetylase (PgdA/CDA1 family)
MIDIATRGRDAPAPLAASGKARGPIVLLSFDLEEFDLPNECGQALPHREQMRAGAAGVEPVLSLLEKHGITATFFVTAHFADHHAQLVRDIAGRHEIASHSYFHSRFDLPDVWRSRDRLQQITAEPIYAFRRPRLVETNRHVLQAAGFRYNSSTNPTWIPGRYNNLNHPRRPFRTGALWQLPISVTPRLRVPLFWLSFKHLPRAVLRRAMRRTLEVDGQLNLFFHPWEFIDLSPYDVPWTVRRCQGQAMVDRLDHHLHWLNQRARFVPFTGVERYLPPPADPIEQQILKNIGV